jgi:hypothetical protein
VTPSTFTSHSGEKEMEGETPLSMPSPPRGNREKETPLSMSTPPRGDRERGSPLSSSPPQIGDSPSVLEKRKRCFEVDQDLSIDSHTTTETRGDCTQGGDYTNR